jgi:WD40 repeat protein
MPRLLSISFLLGTVAVASGDAPLVVRGEQLPAGAVDRFGIPGPHQNEFILAGGHTPSGSFRVAVAKGKDIHIWSWQPAADRPPVHLLSGHAADVQLVAMSPDARFLTSADKSGEVRAWDLANAESFVLRKPGDAVTALAVSAEGRRVIVAVGRTVTLHDRTADRRIKIGDHERDVTALAFAPDESRLATADARGRVTVWKLDGAKVAVLAWDPIPEPKAASLLAPPILKGDRTIRPAPGVIDFGQGVRKLDFSPDGKRLVAAGGTVVRAWDIGDQKVLWQHNRHARIMSGGFGFAGGMPPPDTGPRQIGGLWDIAYSRDGHYVASSGQSGDVRIVHAGHGEDLRESNATERFTVRETHFTGRVGLAFDPDGKSLTMFDGARKFVRETVVGGKFLGSVGGHGRSITGLAVAPDGKWLASEGDDQRIRIWRIATGECVAEPRPAHGEGRGMAFSPDGKWLVAGGAYHGFSVLEKSGDPPTFTEQKGFDVIRYQVHAFVPGHEARLFVASHYGSARAIDLADRKEHGPGFAVSDDPKCMAISPDGKWVAVAFGYSSTPAPRVFDRATGKELPPMHGPPTSGIDAVRFSPDSRLLAGGGQSGVTLWDVVTGKKYLHFGKPQGTAEALAFSPDGRVLVSGGDRELRIWEVATGRLLGARQADSRAVIATAFLPQPGRLASAGTDGAVLIWDVSKELVEAASVPKELSRGVTAPAETGYWSRRFPIEGRLGGVAFSPDGNTLVAGTQLRHIHLFDLKTGKERGKLQGHGSEVRNILYSPDGKTIVSTGYLWDGKELPVRAWDADTGQARWARGGTGTFPDAIALSPDGGIVYALGHGGIRRWELKSGEPLAPVKAYERYTGAMAVSPDGKYLMVGGFQGEVVLWDLADSRQIRTWRATEHERSNFVQALTFAPDSKTAVTTASDGQIRLWDVATGDKLKEWKIGGGVSAAVYSPKGDLLALVGDPIQSGHTGRVSIWDPKTGRERLRLVGYGPRVAWSADGRWLATADVEPFKKESFVLVWDVKTLLDR